MDSCAGIVLYNPSIVKLKENIIAIFDQVKKIVLVDNGSKNIEEIVQLVSCINTSDKIILIKNNENLGIGKALNQILDFADREGYEWFLSLDQDSICGPKLVERYISFITQMPDLKIGQITCIISDERLGEIDKEQFKDKDYLEIESCITSGCFNNLKAIKEVGQFNEKLFIDGVDVEISLRLRKSRYSIFKLNYDGLNHTLGDGKIIKILARELSLTQHSPWRSYYMRRNFVYIAREYYSGIEKILLIVKQIVFSIGTIIFENRKIERIKYCLKGIIDGFKL